LPKRNKGTKMIALDKIIHFLGGFGVAAMALPLGMVEAMSAVFVVAVSYTF